MTFYCASSLCNASVLWRLRLDFLNKCGCVIFFRSQFELVRELSACRRKIWPRVAICCDAKRMQNPRNPFTTDVEVYVRVKHCQAEAVCKRPVRNRARSTSNKARCNAKRTYIRSVSYFSLNDSIRRRNAGNGDYTRKLHRLLCRVVEIILRGRGRGNNQAVFPA